MKQLLEKSEAFEVMLIRQLGLIELRHESEPLKATACMSAAFLSIEHASMIRLAFSAGAANSAVVLIRVQYEALVRGAWLLYSATDLQVGKLSDSLSLESEQAAKNLPSVADMLKALETDAPAGLIAPLKIFQLVSRNALNSFVHCGIHALNRSSHGFPEALSVQLIRNSNGLMHMSYRLLANLTQSPEAMKRVFDTYRHFSDCLPTV